MIESIRELLDRDPFQPFRIILTSGDRFDVINPHLLAIGESVLFYYFPRSDHFAFIRSNQIAAVDTISTAA